MPILSGSTASDWTQVWTTSQNAVPFTSPDKYLPIPEIVCPLLINAHIIVMEVASTTARSTWHSAGYVKQLVKLGLAVGGQPDTESRSFRHLSLGKNLLMFPKLTDTYQISFVPRTWFTQVSITLWQFNKPWLDAREYQEAIFDKLTILEEIIGTI